MTATISGDGTSTLINLTTSGNTVLGDASTDTLNVGNGGLVKDASGNVGIGTSSPSNSAKLDAAGSVLSTAATLSTFNANNSGFDFIAASKIGRFFATSTDTTGGVMTFTTGQNGSYTERMRIDSSGNLLVGTTSGQTSRIVTQADGTSTYGMTSNMTAASGTRYHIIFRENGTERGSVTSNGSATSYNTSSDYRLKENIAPMTGALQKVALLKPVTYTWKSTGEADEGFIAHELQEVMPHAVTGEKDAVNADGNPKYQGIDTSFLVATLTAAIQEQQAIITQLQADVEALKAQGINNV